MEQPDLDTAFLVNELRDIASALERAGTEQDRRDLRHAG